MRYIVIICISIVLLVSVTMAQDNDTPLETTEFDNGTLLFEYPVGWNFQQVANLVLLFEGSDPTQRILLYPADVVDDVVTEDTDAETRLRLFLESVDIIVDGSVFNVFETDIAFIGAIATDSDGGYLVTDKDGELVLIVVANGERALDAGLLIAQTLNEGSVTLSTLPTVDAPTVPPLLAAPTRDPNAPCKIRTDQANTVQLRLGAGFNRTVITFLPANESFEILSEETDTNGNLWYELDKEATAPESAASELWVLASDIITENCGTALEATPPTQVGLSPELLSTIDLDRLPQSIRTILSGEIGDATYTYTFRQGATLSPTIAQFQMTDANDLIMETCHEDDNGDPVCENLGTHRLIGENVWFLPVEDGGRYLQMVEEGVIRYINVDADGSISPREYVLDLATLPAPYQAVTTLDNP